MPRLMIVDDEPLIRDGLSKLVKRIAPEWEVSIEASDGREAVQSLQNERVDLIISDIKMPNMDGIQFMKCLFDKGLSTPVILLTGYGEFQYARQALRYHAFDYLLKPIRETEMRKVLDRFIEEKYVPVGKSIDNIAHHQFKQWEFDLNNALDSYDKERVGTMLAEEAEGLSADFPATLIVNQAIRIINTFFLKKGVIGLEYSPNVTHERLTAQLASIAKRTIDLLDQLNSRKLPESNRIIEQTKAYMKANLDKPLTLTDVANHVHFNPTYFSEYFRDKTGETFSNYLMRLRIEEAKVRLKSPEPKINEIAERLGYQDARHFSKLFKLMVGITPSEYRANAMDQTRW